MRRVLLFSLFPALVATFNVVVTYSQGMQYDADRAVTVIQAFPDIPAKIILTRARNGGEGSGILVAPGKGNQEYTIHQIDTKDFVNGGIVTFRITVGDGESDASFDLFPEGAPIPTTGRPIGSVAGRYDILKGSTTTMSYRFQRGQVFQFGADGNWFSRKGAGNTYTFEVWVTE